MASFGTWPRASARKKKVQPRPAVIWTMRAVNSKRRGADPSVWTLATDGFENLDRQAGALCDGGRVASPTEDHAKERDHGEETDWRPPKGGPADIVAERYQNSERGGKQYD